MGVIIKNGVLYGGAPNVEAASGPHINEPGTPSVTATARDGTVTLTFDYLKGSPGENSAQADWTQSDPEALSYIKHKPTLGTASEKNIAVTGNASTAEVVMGNDTRLSDARNAADVYPWAKQSSKPNYNANEVNAVSTEANQNLTSEQQDNARDNIGLGSAALKNAPASGNASSSQVVMGDDTRLTDSRNAADVYSWAKAETKPSYNADEVNAVSTESNQGLTSEQQDNARDNIGLGSAALKNVPTTGDASTVQVVMGDDTRLTDARNAADVYSWAKAETKPSYTATEVGAVPVTSVGANSGVAELDENGKVPSSQLPSFVDDVIEGYYDDNTDRFYEESTFETVIPPESGKAWVDISTNKSYRWTGSVYTRVDEGVQLGETSSTAYRGDRGKTAYDHSQVVTGNPHNVTKSDVGLGNVGNFKAVSTEAEQGLTATEQANARANIGAGTSSFDGAYSSLTGTPTLGTASDKNVAATGDASTTEVVMGNDSRLTDARNAADVYSWAKAENKPSYTANEVNAVSTEANQDLTSEEQANARANIGAGTSSFDGAYSSLSGKPTLGTASEKDVPASGNATSVQVVMGNDTRLSDSRNAADVYSWAKAETKPTYTANEVGAISSTLKGSSNGVAELDENGKVPNSQLPSFVDDVVEAYYDESNDTFYKDSAHQIPITPEGDKIYINLTTNKTYRWGGTTYVTIGSDLAIGETSSTAYRGDRGKELYDAFGGKSAISTIDTSADIPTSNAVKNYVDTQVSTYITNVINAEY